MPSVNLLPVSQLAKPNNMLLIRLNPVSKQDTLKLTYTFPSDEILVASNKIRDLGMIVDDNRSCASHISIKVDDMQIVFLDSQKLQVVIYPQDYLTLLYF